MSISKNDSSCQVKVCILEISSWRFSDLTILLLRSKNKLVLVWNIKCICSLFQISVYRQCWPATRHSVTIVVCCQEILCPGIGQTVHSVPGAGPDHRKHLCHIRTVASVRWTWTPTQVHGLHLSQHKGGADIWRFPQLVFTMSGGDIVQRRTADRWEVGTWCDIEVGQC